MSKKHQQEEGRRDPRYARTVQFSRQEFEMLRIAAERAGSTRSAVIREAVRGMLTALAERWVRPSTRDKPAVKPAKRPVAKRVRTAWLNRCTHSRTAWHRERGVPPYCRLCVAPICRRCRTVWQIWGLSASEEGLGVGIYEPRCRCRH